MNIASAGKTLALLKRISDPEHTTEPLVSAKPQKPYFQDTKRKLPIQYARPENLGINPELISQYILEIYNTAKINIHNILIMRKGKVIFDCGFGAQDINIWKATFSECKSITSLAIGILIGEGKIGTETKLSDIFTQKPSLLTQLTRRDMTIENLLTMSSQIIFNEAECMASEDWQKSFFNSALYSESGKGFNYNSLNTYMLSAIVKEVSGKGLCEFLDEKIFSELDITNYFWEKCPSGIEKGGWGLYITPYDLAKIGQLLLNNGLYESKQLIPSDYVSLATSKRNDPPKSIGSYDYGYQIWVGRDSNSFLFNGMLGQNMFCYKNNGITIVTNAGNGDSFQRGPIFSVTDKYFAGNFPDKLPLSNAAYRSLVKTKKQLETFIPQKPKHLYDRIFKRKIQNEFVKSISGITYKTTSKEASSTGLAPLVMQVIQNNYTKGTISYLFNTDGKSFWLNYGEADRNIKFEIGFEKPAINRIEPLGEKCIVACIGEFKKNEDDETVLKLKLDFLEFPYTRTIKFTFGKDTLTVKYGETPGDILLGEDGLGIEEKLASLPFISSFASAGGAKITEKSKILFEPIIYAKASK